MSIMNTTKKTYVQPSTHVVEVGLPSILAGSTNIDPSQEGNGQDAGSRLFSDDDDDEWFE